MNGSVKTLWRLSVLFTSAGNAQSEAHGVVHISFPMFKSSSWPYYDVICMTYKDKMSSLTWIELSPSHCEPCFGAGRETGKEYRPIDLHYIYIKYGHMGQDMYVSNQYMLKYVGDALVASLVTNYLP